MIAFAIGTRIARPIEEVFTYVSDPLNLPHWNAAVRSIRKTSNGANDAASTYSMERELPAGRAVNELEIVVRERQRELGMRTTSGPTPFHYRFRLSAENGETVVQLDAEIELQGVAALVPQLARPAIQRGVGDNLATLKRILEA